jgi:AraC-like DNA-binding protein
MLSIPRAHVQVPHALVRPLTGTLIPRSLPDRSLVAQFLIGLITPAAPAPDPDLADVLRDSVTDLIRTRLGLSTGINPRTLHSLCRRGGCTATQLIKQVRLQECHRDLRDPALATKPVGHIRAAHGYPRADQFARDFRQQFGLSPSQTRHHTPDGGSAYTSRSTTCGGTNAQRSSPLVSAGLRREWWPARQERAG